MTWDGRTSKSITELCNIVQVTDAGICIGSPYIHDIIVIDSEGAIVKRGGCASNEDLARYLDKMDADPAKLKNLVQTPDAAFTASHTVYTFDGSDIIEKQCEELGWPNLTHDGEIQYDNRHSVDRATVIEWALREAEAGVSVMSRLADEHRRKLAETEADIAEYQRDVQILTELAAGDA